MIHLSLLRNHARWAVFLRNLQFIVVDECHYYRGIFGSNVAMVLRRLVRLCERYSAGDGAGPTVIFASATDVLARRHRVGTARAHRRRGDRRRLPTGRPDGRPVGTGPARPTSPARTALRCGDPPGAEAARVMADLIAEGARTLTFVRSRRGAELTALGARARLEDVAPDLADLVASYRAGYLAEDRRALERALSDGELRGLATTNALELGVDIAGLDAVVLAGFPGTVDVVLAAGGAGGATRAERPDRADRPRRPAGHLPGAPSRPRCWTSRSNAS